MKAIKLKIYLAGFLFYILGIISYKLTQGSHDFFITLFTGMIISILFINTSSILFYRSLKSNDKYLKYIFSFLHILGLATLTLIVIR